MKADTLGQFIVPVGAIAYSAYMILEQFRPGSNDSTRDYAMVAGGLAIVLSVAVIVRALWSIWSSRPAAASDEPESELPSEQKTEMRRRYIQMGLLILATALLVAFFEPVGYVISFFIYMVATLLIVDVRSVKQILAISIVTTAIVHFLFVQWLGVTLPAGLLASI